MPLGHIEKLKDGSKKTNKPTNWSVFLKLKHAELQANPEKYGLPTDNGMGDRQPIISKMWKELSKEEKATYT